VSEIGPNYLANRLIDVIYYTTKLYIPKNRYGRYIVPRFTLEYKVAVIKIR